ncbi:MAG: phosphate ABC transporter substrate-binding protein [Rhodospirillaceae bacterium BRH_c57]|nr:MAG: phosphate ABC transporter substrate-binding protein [Rhodospirillaceae bacterium BRH_c57]
MLKKTLALAAVASVATVAIAGAAQARDQIRIVGSSTVYPFTTVVAENFGRGTGFKTPIIESTGTGGGFKLFCAGVGTDHPDFTNASRPIKKSEFETCAKNGVAEIVELRIGYDGLVMSNSKQAEPMTATRAQIFLALAKEIPVDGKWVANPNKKWSDVDASLPAIDIEVLGPPPTSGTRDSFVELALEVGCETFPEVKALDKAGHKEKCQSIREDGAFVEAGENDNLIVQKLDANPKAFGIFGFSFLDQNGDKLQGVNVEGVTPTFETIASGEYPVSRPLQIYAKKAHIGVIPGMKEFLAEYASDKAMGANGYLTDKGLVPLPADQAVKYRKNAVELVTMSAGDI